MSTFEEEMQRDWAAYEQLRPELLEKHFGKYVAIAGGKLLKVVEIGDRADYEAFDEVRAAIPKKYKHRMAFKVTEEGPTRGFIRHGGSTHRYS